jgi:FHS family L-fucose permease-like MFS transporter
LLLVLNAAVLLGACGMLSWVILATLHVAWNDSAWWMAGGLSLAVAAAVLVPLARRTSTRSIWSHSHFSAATLAQFFYVAAQAGIFSFFINTLTPDRRNGFTIVPPIPRSWDSALAAVAAHAGPLRDWLGGWFESGAGGLLHISNKGAANLASVAFVCFLLGRVSGSWLLKKSSAHKVLGLYCLLNVGMCFLIFLKLGWLSVGCVFLSYFFMSIMFPTIFALGIFGLGVRAKKASSYIVMAIIGGAILPKLMGEVADRSDMPHGFLVPMACFALVALYAYAWPKLSHAESLSSGATAPPEVGVSQGG